MITATYRIIYYPTVGRYLALAWNFQQAVLISTKDYPTALEALAELQATCVDRSVSLDYFEGSFEHDATSDQIVRSEGPQVPPRAFS